MVSDNSRPKLLHVLGAGFYQVPTIQKAKSLGYRVLVTDKFEQRPGYEFADYHEVVDIRDAEGTLTVARKYSIDGILCDTTDVAVPTAAYIAEKLHLPGIGYETAINFTNKAVMRKKTFEAGISNPVFRVIVEEAELQDAAKRVGYPLIVKPADSQGSRGITRVTSSDQLLPAYDRAKSNSVTGEVLVEEWLSGTEVTVEGICFKGNYQTLAISDKTRNPEVPQCSARITYPPNFSDKIIDQIKATNLQVVKLLGLQTGVTHAEYIVSNDKVFLVEIAARGGGNRIYTHIVPYISGIDVIQKMIKFALGEDFEVEIASSEKRAANVEFLSFKPGIVNSVNGLDQASSVPGVLELVFTLRPGDRFQKVDNDTERPGFVLSVGADRKEVLSTGLTAKDLLKVDIS